MSSVDEVIVDLEAFAEKAVKKIVVNSTANLKQSTPVDTGFARSNWVPQIGSKFNGLSGARDSISSGNQDAGLLSVLTGYKLNKGKVYITNNTDYIAALDAGHSKQEPAGFVLRSINKAIASAL